jgi:hypothetical protein
VADNAPAPEDFDAGAKTITHQRIAEAILEELVENGRVIRVQGHRHNPPPGYGFPRAATVRWASKVCQCSVEIGFNSPELYRIEVYLPAPLWDRAEVVP